MKPETAALSQHIDFIDSSAVKSRPGAYLPVTVRVDKILKSWRASLFAHEWMRPDGQLKSAPELSETERPKREAVETLLRAGGTLEKPVLGIGLLDSVEIGAGRATFLTLAAHGMDVIPVHIPASQQKEFKGFLA